MILKYLRNLYHLQNTIFQTKHIRPNFASINKYDMLRIGLYLQASLDYGEGIKSEIVTT